jgi:drug/metabolite transporter (DMT)-like permease
MGYGLVLLAGTLWSFGGLIVRNIESASEWQFLFYRSTSIVAALLVVLAVRNRSRIVMSFRTVGWVGVIAGLCSAGSFIAFIFSLTHTTVANSLFLASSSPFIAAVLGWVLLGERVRPATWIAIIGAFLGVGVMVWEGAAVGSLFGNLTALAAAFGFAGFTVALRWGRAVEMLPAVCLAGLFAAVVSGLMTITTGEGLMVTSHDFLLCLIYGGLIVGGGLAIYTIGSRYIPAAELTLLSMAEVVLGPVWVWVGIGEVPSGMTLLGGSIVLFSIAGLAISGFLRRRFPVSPF